MNMTELTVKQLAQALDRKEVSAREAAEAYLRAIEEKDAAVGAYLTVTRELALKQASIASGISVSRKGASPSVPAYAEVQAVDEGVLRPFNG